MYEDMMKAKLMLFNKRIGISVSESEKYNRLGFSRMSQSDITGELVKYLMINGAHVVYGGDTREDGYTYTFSALAEEFNPAIRNGKCLTNYFAWPVHLHLKEEEKQVLKKAELIKVTAHQSVPISQRGTSVFNDYREARYYQALSLSKMREKMVSECDARIFVGGKLTDYSGLYPGILEEAYLALQHKQPMYFAGALNGATSIIIRAIMGEDENTLAYELHDWYPELEDMYRYKTARQQKDVKPEDMLARFRKLGVKGLSRLNKLTEKENEILFNSAHFHEILYHNLIGLKRAL